MSVRAAQLLLNVGRGTAVEPSIDNETFLRSFVTFSVWARVLAARKALRWATEGNGSALERLAAGATFYQLTSLIFEDVVAALASWCCWTVDRSLPLADVVGRLNMKRGAQSPGTVAEFCADAVRTIQRSGTVRLDPLAFLERLQRHSDVEILALIGIRPATAVRYTNPGAMTDLVRLVSQSSARYLIPIHNKLKHGPQVVVMTVGEAATRRQLRAPVDVPGDRLRLLFDGGRTQERPDEDSAVRVAPFLLHEAEALHGILFGILVPVAAILCQAGSALYEDAFARRVPAPDSAVHELILELSRVMAAGGDCAVPH